MINSKIESDSESLDIDAVVIASFLHEWYPDVRITVDIKNENSINIIESNIFTNDNADISKLYTYSFMSGKVFDTTKFFSIGSRLRHNPFEIKFLQDLWNFENKTSNVIPLVINSQYAGKTYKELSDLLLNHEEIPLLTLGVFTSKWSKSMNQYLEQLLNLDEHHKKGRTEEEEILESSGSSSNSESEKEKISPMRKSTLKLFKSASIQENKDKGMFC